MHRPNALISKRDTMRNCREPGTETESSEDILAKLLAILARQVKAAKAQPQPKENAECVMSFNLPTNVVRYLDYLVQHGSHGASRKSERPNSRSNLIALAIEDTPFTYEKLSEALEMCKAWRRDQGTHLVSARISARSVELLCCLAGRLGSCEKPVSVKAAGEALVFFWSQVNACPKYEEVEAMILQQPVPPLKRKRKRREKAHAEPNKGGGRTARLVRRSPRSPVHGA